MHTSKLTVGVAAILAAILLNVGTTRGQEGAASKPAVAAEPGAANAGKTTLPSLSSVGLKVGDIVNKGNAEQYPNALTPGLKSVVNLGWRLRVKEPQHIEMPRLYREATEKHAGQSKLAKDGLLLDNHVAGLPFPSIDPNDPQIALKVMWNYAYNWTPTDDVCQKGVDTYVGAVRAGQPMVPERHLLTEVYRKLFYTARLYVDPKPELPNPERVRFKESLHPILEPFDVKGVGATFYRYLDADKQDDSWVYLPQLRRVRRMSTAQRSDALFGQDVDADAFNGYNGHIAWMNFRYLGERTVLATMHSQNQPIKWQNPEDWLYDDVWEPRNVYIIEALSKMPAYGYGKRILFVDKEAWVIPFSDTYDKADELWKLWVNFYGARKIAMPNGPVPPYEDEWIFLNGAVVVDVQLGHATSTGLPRTTTDRNAGVYYNVGESMGVTEDFFTVAHLISSGK
jgi:hypothetical protein